MIGGDDANENAELCNHMDQYEQSNVKNAASDDWANNEEENSELNKHMDEYEGWGSDFDNINKLFLKKTSVIYIFFLIYIPHLLFQTFWLNHI